MEGLTLDDGRQYYRRAEYRRSTERRHRSPRLPTPEDSRSSNDAFDQCLPDATPYRRPSPVERGGLMSIPAGHSRRDSRNTGVLHSPPYTMSDAQKPSLPPLKTVLGDRLTSPPRTPSPENSSIQPSPREPLYVTSTYMPPSLYPNKKQRTDPFLDSAPPHRSTTHLRHPLPPSTTLEPTPNAGSIGTHVRFPPLAAPLANSDARRVPHGSHCPPWSEQFPPHQSKLSGNHVTSETAASHYQTPERTPTSSMLEPSFPRFHGYPGAVQDPFAREMRESLAHPSDRPASRRSSATGYGAYPSRPYDHEGTRYPIHVREGYADGRRNGAYGRVEEQSRSTNGFGHAPYQSNVPAFFMPSHYEYQHGKARKRSNLPKQSTEIMKTWFDQNITNPYPSEEQKAIFSNATGISMTQVSNWFINHRRRCPELRDKREKNRNGRDGDA